MRSPPALVSWLAPWKTTTAWTVESRISTALSCGETKLYDFTRVLTLNRVCGPLTVISTSQSLRNIAVLPWRQINNHVRFPNPSSPCVYLFTSLMCIVSPGREETGCIMITPCICACIFLTIPLWCWIMECRLLKGICLAANCGQHPSLSVKRIKDLWWILKPRQSFEEYTWSKIQVGVSFAINHSTFAPPSLFFR